MAAYRPSRPGTETATSPFRLLQEPVLVGYGFGQDGAVEVGVELPVEFVGSGFVEVLVFVVQVVLAGMFAVEQEAAAYPVEKVFEEVMGWPGGVQEADAWLERGAAVFFAGAAVLF
jgi:hypothetical protein